MTVHCVICVNLGRYDVAGPVSVHALDRHGGGAYRACPGHAPLIAEHGLQGALRLLRSENSPTERAI